MFGSFDISSSALSAERIRLDTIASNLANVDTVLGPNHQPQPYRRLFATFQTQRTPDGGVGVGVASIEQDTQTPFRMKLEPGSPAADANGWVRYPNVDLSTEYVNALETTRAYEANITAIETTKSMINSALRILA
ncbi:MAG TPA: flagellar basal body rod protein FlgC [Phycisphaerae bacterium]|jgi:flagellar basal-body rod protein FlgC|nr:flagellar basal body rod protein FlgC [Phycisphaerae bacterium]